MYQVTYGAAIARYIRALTGRDMDLVYDPEADDVEPVVTWGGFLSINHDWLKTLYSYVTFGMTLVNVKDYQPDDAFDNSMYLSGNLFWEPMEETRLGVEYAWGRRENKNGESGTANRISFIIYYDF
jgi:hypothetical protein